MKCLVPVKRVIDYNVKIRIRADGSNVEKHQVKMSMNPFDEIALEEAQRLKEKGIISEMIAVSIGSKASEETLRVALARGADRAILIEQEGETEPFNVALILKQIIEKENISLVLMGKQAIDDDCNQTGQMLAGFLNWAQGTNVSKVNLEKEKKTVEVTREVDGGLENLKLNLPAVITVDLRLNEPRYISLPNIMKAKSKPLTTVPVADLGLNLKPHMQLLKVEPPALHRSVVIVETVKELVGKLMNEAKVI